MREEKIKQLILKIIDERFENRIEKIVRDYLTEYESVKHVTSHMESSLKWTVPNEIRKLIKGEKFIDGIIERIKKKQL